MFVSGSSLAYYGKPQFGDMDGVISKLKKGAKKVGGGAAKVVKKAPSAALKTAATVAKTPFKAAASVAKTGADVVSSATKSVADIAKSAGKVAGTVALAPTRFGIEVVKGTVGGAVKTVGGAFKSSGGGEPSQDTREAAIEVAQSQGITSPEALKRGGADAYSTSAAPGLAPDAEAVSRSLATRGEEEGEGEAGKRGMSLALKVGIAAGAALALYLGYKMLRRGRRGGGRTKS